MFFTGVTAEDEVRAVSDALNIPVFLGGPGTGNWVIGNSLPGTASGLAAGHHPFMASVQATYETLKSLRNGASPEDIIGKASSEFMNTVTCADDYQRRMKEYLGG